MKRNWHVKVVGKPTFSMIIMNGEESPDEICRAIFGDRLEWVK